MALQNYVLIGVLGAVLGVALYAAGIDISHGSAFDAPPPVYGAD